MPLPGAQGISATQPVIQNANATPFAVVIQEGRLIVTNAGATTNNIPAPVAGQDDFVKIEIFSTTAFAHVFAFGANKLNGNKTSFTWTKAVAGKIGEIMAFNGVWFFTGNIADAAAFAQQVTLA
jgi:hypothetical protein